MGVRRNHYTRSAARARKAAQALTRDADDLKKHGYKNEAAAVRREADRKLAKADFKEQVAAINARRSAGKKLVTNLLGGPFANRSYQSLQAAGYSKTVAAGVTYVSAMMAGPIGPIVVSHFVAEGAYDRRR